MNHDTQYINSVIDWENEGTYGHFYFVLPERNKKLLTKLFKTFINSYDISIKTFDQYCENGKIEYHTEVWLTRINILQFTPQSK